VEMGLIAKRLGLVLAFAACAPGGAGAQDNWPAKQLSLVIGYPAGGPADAVARIVGNELSRRAGQTIIIENRAGADGNIAAIAVARSQPDGYTLLYVTPNIVAGPSLYKAAIDPIEELVPIIQTVSGPMALLVNKQLPVNSVADLVALAKSKPGTLSCGAAGGTPGIACQLFRSRVDPGMLIVPYKGQAPAMTSLMGGEISMIFEPVNTAQAAVSSEHLKALATTGLKRTHKIFSGLATVAETIPDFDLTVWQGLMGPKGMSKDLAITINRQINAALDAPEVRSRLEDAGIEVAGGSPDAFGQWIKTERTKIAALLTAAGVVPR